jgi:hypothetical protein
LSKKGQEATRPAGLVYAQHRGDGVYRRADWRDRLQRSRCSESAVTLPESLPLTFAGLAVTFPESPVTLDRNTQLANTSRYDSLRDVVQDTTVAKEVEHAL